MGKEVDNTFTWVIKNFSSYGQAEEIYSEQFSIGGCNWHLIVYPEVDNVDDYMPFSLYLDVSDSESLPCGWRIHAKFSLNIINQLSEKLSQLQETQQWFDQSTPGWGCLPMLTHKKLSEKDGGFVVNDEVIIVATVDVLEVIGAIDASENSQSIDVKGFQVLPSQVKSVNRLFERHPDIASNLSIKNQSLKTAYMNVLLSLTETLHQSPKKISKDDLSDAETTLASLKNVGFKLDWLENKFDELFEKKEKEAADEIRMQKIEQELKDMKHKWSELEASLLKKEKAEVLDLRSPFNDILKWHSLPTMSIEILFLSMILLLL